MSIISQGSKGPPGKFYHEQPALTLLDTVRTGGQSARIVPESNSDENVAQHFDRFRARLEGGDLVRLSIILFHTRLTLDGPVRRHGWN
jgi:hypothetical protein